MSIIEDDSMGTDAVHEELARLLAEVLRSGDQPLEVARRSVRGPSDPITDLDSLYRMLDDVGCVPHVVAPTDGPTPDEREIVLGRCCYEAAATVAPSPVCGLHLGLLERSLSGSPMSVSALEPGDPCRAGCRVTVRLCDRTTPVAENV